MNNLHRALSAAPFLLLACLFSDFAAAQEPAQPPVTGVDTTGDEATAETTLSDQTDVAVTVYNNNLGLVRDRRKLSLPTGEQRLRFSDVAQQIRPETVSLESVARPGSLTVLEQNYEFDLISPAKLMEKYVGKAVELIGYDRDLRFERVAARLLSVNDGPIFEIDGDIYLGHPGNVVLPEIPENLVARPSLLWLLVNEAPDPELELTYLTYGLRWNADYVVTLDPSEEHVDIQGWVTLTNESGAEYKNARLKLVAGDVNIIQPPMGGLGGGGVAPPYFKTMEAAPLQQEAFAEYHLYTLPRRTTLRQNQSKQVNLLEASGVTVEKAYELESHPPLFGPVPELPEARVAVVIKFRNEEAAGLGMPLPAGIMRVYQEDREGTLQFAGEDRIEHTPRDEEVSLRIGSAFDIVAERLQTDFQQIAENVTVSAFNITLRNHKEEPVSVEVVEHIGGQWEILESSTPHEKRDAATAVFKVDVPADGETVLTYRVQTTLGPPRPLPLGRPAPGIGYAPAPVPRALPGRPAPPAPGRPAPLPPDAPVSSGPAAAPPPDAPVSSAPAAPGVRVGGTGRRPAR